MAIYNWISGNWIEIFGALTGIVYVFLEIRQNIWLWPVGIITSAVYITVFFTSKFYADMSLQVYYLAISCLGWYWWMKGAGLRTQSAGVKGAGMEQGDEPARLPSLEGSGVGFDGTGHRPKALTDEGASVAQGKGQRAEGKGQAETKSRRDEGPEKLSVTRLKLKTGIILTIVFVLLYFLLWFILSRLTDSPVPEWDSFITSLSIVATWMLARKIYEHWFLWIVVNSASSVIFMARGLYPTVILYVVYLLMSFAGLKAWKRSL